MPRITRRGFLAGAVAGTALAGCSGKHAAHNSAAQNAKTKLPNYIPYAAIRPDLPGNAAGAMPGYFSYPRNPKRAITTRPAAGMGEVTLLTTTYTPPPTGTSSNKFWQQINKQIGATFAISLTPDDSWSTKSATVIASGNVPDVLMFAVNVQHEPQILSTLFADLSEYLAGDAVKDYPFLANMPTRSWIYTVANGGIFGVPQPRAVTGHATFYRSDLLDDPNPGSYAEFVDMMRSVTNPKKNRWAYANAPNMLMLVQQMLGAPNNWAIKNGEFTSAITDDRTKQALGNVRSMVKEGLFYPDAFSTSYTGFRELFLQGRTALLTDGYAAWDLLANQVNDNVGALVEPKYDGGGDVPRYAGASVQATVSIKKGLGAAKTKKILGVLNWLAAPIGTEEYLFRKFGIEGHDFTWQNGVPTLNQTGTNETQMALQYVTDAPTILGPAPKKRVIAQHDWHVRVTKNLVYDPSAGLFSDTQASNGPKLALNIGNAQLAIMQGHKPLSSWDDAVREWRSGGGDAIARELTKAYHQRNPQVSAQPT
jgi:putative aldouronate transport system substrate-binding protein